MKTSRDIPIGIYEKALPASFSWPERLDAAARAGYDFVEISIDESDERLARLEWGGRERSALRDAVAAAGLPVLTMCLSGHRKYPLGSESVSVRAKSLEIMEKAIALAVDVGIRIIQVAGYDVYYEASSAETQARFLAGLRQGVVWAEQAAVMLAVETMDCEFMNSVDKVMSLVREINSPWLQLYPDIGNLSAWGQDLDRELEAGRGHIVAVHVKDTVQGEFRRVPFGQGRVPFTVAFRKLAALGYRGPLLVEMWNDDAPDAVEIIARARRWIGERIARAWGE
jgi:L-ribulose-5-phosphate 3-epimerase